MPTPAGVDARLWESMTRGAAFPGMQPGTPVMQPGAPGTAMTARAEQLSPADLALTPGMVRERGQAFLRSIQGSDQTAVSEYESVAQAKAWGGSTCSAAALVAVLRAAGQNVKISDVMKEMPGGMTIALGLLSRSSLVNAANTFGAGATDDVRNYEELKAATDNGQPVIVSIRNAKFPDGHFIVVTGVDDRGITCADSSRLNLTSISKSELLRTWDSRGIRIEGFTPNAAPARGTTRSA